MKWLNGTACGLAARPERTSLSLSMFVSQSWYSWKKERMDLYFRSIFSIFLLSSFLVADMPSFSRHRQLGNWKSSHIVLSRLGLLNLSTFGRSHAKMHFRVSNVLTDLLTFATTTTTTTSQKDGRIFCWVVVGIVEWKLKSRTRILRSSNCWQIHNIL